MPLAVIARGIKAATSSTSILCRVLEDGRMIARTATGSVLGCRTVVASIVEELRLAVDLLSNPLIRRPITC
jgi:hypothetical protein